MKKAIFLIICSTIFSLSSRSQSIEETIDYLNFELSNFVFDFPPFEPLIDYRDPTLLAYDQNWQKTNFKLKLNEKGCLHIYKSLDLYTIPKGTKIKNIYFTSPIITTAFKEYNYYIYLKQLSDSVEFTIDEFTPPELDTTIYSYYVVLHCKNDEMCIINDSKNKESGSALFFIIINEEHGIKIKNAFEHLIQLGYENPNYWVKDPFE